MVDVIHFDLRVAVEAQTPHWGIVECLIFLSVVFPPEGDDFSSVCKLIIIHFESCTSGIPNETIEERLPRIDR